LKNLKKEGDKVKRILVICIFLMLFVYVGNAQEINYTNPSEKIYNPPITKEELQNYVRSVSVQIVVMAEKHYRALRWLKYEPGDRLTDQEFARLNDDEKEWYLQGYKLGSKTAYETDAYPICGSGVIVYSDVLKSGIQASEGCHGATYILTNWHVVDMLVDYNARRYESCGNFSNPQYVYAEADIIRNTYPPSVKIREGARPIGEQYFTMSRDYVTIKHSAEQSYRVQAEIAAVDRALDVAVLRLKNVWGLPYTIFRGTPCRVGEEIWMCGAPLALPFSIDVGRTNQVGLNLGVSGGIAWDNQIKMDIAAAPGSSGSGILDADGKLIALEHGVLVYGGNYISGGHLAISGMDVREWLIWNSFSFIVDADEYNPHKTKQ